MMIRMLSFVIFFSCSPMFAQSWNQVIDYPGSLRDDATGFSIGDFGYVMTGMDNGFNTTRDGFKYHAYSYAWYPIDTLPAETRQYSCAFAINGKGYLVGGRGSSYFNDCWEYDPAIDSWTQMDSIPSFGRSSCVCFSINGKGYIGTGVTNGNILTDEWWEFAPDSANQWTQKTNFPGIARKGATGFELNGKGYVTCGIDSDLVMHNDVWEYDPILDTWIPKNNFSGTPRFSAKGISINNVGYVLTGWDSSGTYKNDLWQYNDVADSWIALDTIPSFGRKGGVTFQVNGTLFYTTGIGMDQYRTSETWAFGTTIGIENIIDESINIYPVPSWGPCILQSKIPLESIRLFNSVGQELMNWKYPSFPLYINHLDPGNYFLILQNSDRILAKKLIFY